MIAGGDVLERKEAALKQRISHQQLSKAIEPIMADINDPAPCLLFGRGCVAFVRKVTCESDWLCQSDPWTAFFTDRLLF